MHKPRPRVPGPPRLPGPLRHDPGGAGRRAAPVGADPARRRRAGTDRPTLPLTGTAARRRRGTDRTLNLVRNQQTPQNTNATTTLQTITRTGQLHAAHPGPVRRPGSADADPGTVDPRPGQNHASAGGDVRDAA